MILSCKTVNGSFISEKEGAVTEIVLSESEETSAEVITQEDQFNRWIAAAGELSVAERKGLLAMVSIPDQELSKQTVDFLRKNHIVGVILFRNNIVHEKQVKKLIRDIRDKVNPNMLFSVDQEGGSVVRVSWDKRKDISFAMIGRKGDLSYAYQVAYERAVFLRDLGFDMILGPVCDIAPSKKSFLYDRTFGSNPQLVADMVEVTVKAQKDAGVISVLKHFPGLGNTEIDSHLEFPYINMEKERLKSMDFIPFIRGIQAGAEMVLVGHIRNNYIDELFPASISRKYQDILYQDFGFQGIIITDDMSMTGKIQQSIGWGINLMSGSFVETGKMIERIVPDLTQCAKVLKLLNERKMGMEDGTEKGT